MHFWWIGVLIARLFLLTGHEAVCSWYGSDFHGQLTASGTVYDMNEMTVAHRTLPLGTKLLLFCPETGVWCRARVTDRGPYISGRDIDCSRAVADTLTAGDLDSGIFTVRYRITGRDTTGLRYNLDLPDEGACERERLEW